MSWFKFRNLSVIVICVIKSLIHSLQSKYTRVPGLRKLVFLALLCNFTHHHCNCCIVKVNLPAATSGPSKKEMKITNLTSVVKKEEGSLVENLGRCGGAPCTEDLCYCPWESSGPTCQQAVHLPAEVTTRYHHFIASKIIRVLLDYHLRVKKHCERHNGPKLCAFAKETDQIWPEWYNWV